ncbi:MAG: rhodanese-like domain-containing protein [Saprospiraceae bacterium]
MNIQRFHDEQFDVYSYIVSDDKAKKAAVIDPGRNVQPYQDYLREHNLNLEAVLLTHIPFGYAGGYLELYFAEEVRIHASKKAAANFPTEPLSGTSVIRISDVLRFHVQETPGFTEDSVTFLAFEEGKEQAQAIFTGGTVTVHGVGYPEPRKGFAILGQSRSDAAGELYDSIRKIAAMSPRAAVFPGFGGDYHYSTGERGDYDQKNIQELRDEHPALQQRNKGAFVKWLLKDEPFLPRYYAAMKEANRNGFPALGETIGMVVRDENPITVAPAGPRLIDTRPAADFHAGHLFGAYNLGESDFFPFWLGCVIEPGEEIFLLADEGSDFDDLLLSVAKLGYDRQLRGIARYTGGGEIERDPALDLKHFKETHTYAYTVVDVRPPGPAHRDTRFNGALNIPLYELREKAGAVPRDRPVVVHCGGGWHSAAAASILHTMIGSYVEIYDLGEAIKKFKA